MSVTNTVVNPEPAPVGVLGNSVQGDDKPTMTGSPQQVLWSVLTALREGRVAEAVAHCADRFTFNDHALTLEFTDKPGLTEFFAKTRELFPDTTLEIVSILGEGDHAIAQWKLSATQTVPYGSITYRLPISLFGATAVRVENQKIVQWSDYYDQSSSRRHALAGLFTEWIEY